MISLPRKSFHQECCLSGPWCGWEPPLLMLMLMMNEWIINATGVTENDLIYQREPMEDSEVLTKRKYTICFLEIQVYRIFVSISRTKRLVVDSWAFKKSDDLMFPWHFGIGGNYLLLVIFSFQGAWVGSEIKLQKDYIIDCRLVQK